MDHELVFTPSAVLSLLTEIEELDGKEISFTENEDSVEITIDEAVYTIEAGEAAEVEIDEDSLDAVADVNEEGYSDLEQNSNISFEEADDPVEGGIIKELVKTLAIGGLVRLTSNAIKNG